MESLKANDVLIRIATVRDVQALSALINGFAAKGLMLPRSNKLLCQFIREFVVAVIDDKVVGCGGLHIWTDNIAEVRSLAIDEEFQGMGIGKTIVQRLMDDSKFLGIPKVFALTYKEQFFNKLGFQIVEKDMLSPKVWGDCLNCPKLACCDEIAMAIDIELED